MEQIDLDKKIAEWAFLPDNWRMAVGANKTNVRGQPYYVKHYWRDNRLGIGNWEWFAPSIDLNSCAIIESIIEARGLSKDYDICLLLALGEEPDLLMEYIKAGGIDLWWETNPQVGVDKFHTALTASSELKSKAFSALIDTKGTWFTPRMLEIMRLEEAANTGLSINRLDPS